MSVIAEVSVPPESFALSGLFTAHPDASIEVECLASHGRERVMPAVWLIAPDPVAAAETARADPAVESVSLIDVDGGAAYATIRWGERVTAVVDAIVDRGGVLEAASASAAAWELALKFAARDALADFQTFADERDLAIELRRLSEASTTLGREYGLTPEQREVLDTALELGYFDVPRQAQIDDLAAALDISTNSVSERLRRATKSLTRNTIDAASTDRGPTRPSESSQEHG